LLLPSAQRFISALDENVNVEVRLIGALTGPLTPWRLPLAGVDGCVWGPSEEAQILPLPDGFL